MSRVAHDQVEDLYPLSPMQQGMLFHTLAEPGSGVYVEQIRLGLQGLDPSRFRAAWERAFGSNPDSTSITARIRSDRTPLREE